MAESNGAEQKSRKPEPPGSVARVLGWVERVGNKLPDPAAMFVIALLLVWVASWLLSGHEFTVPAKDGPRTLAVANQLSGTSLAALGSLRLEWFSWRCLVLALPNTPGSLTQA